MYSYKNSLLPNKFKNVFLLNNQTHSYNKRIADAFNLPFCRTNARQFSVCYQGPKYFNSLDEDICNSVSLSSFKSSLKQNIYSNKALLSLFLTLHAIFFPQILLIRFPCIRLNCTCINPLTVFKSNILHLRFLLRLPHHFVCNIYIFSTLILLFCNVCGETNKQTS